MVRYARTMFSEAVEEEIRQSLRWQVWLYQIVQVFT